VTFQVGGGRRLARRRDRPRGGLVGFQQRTLPAGLWLVLGLASRAVREVAPRVVLGLRILFDQVRNGGPGVPALGTPEVDL